MDCMLYKLKDSYGSRTIIMKSTLLKPGSQLAKSIQQSNLGMYFIIRNYIRILIYNIETNIF